jgi:hypothetical protein
MPTRRKPLSSREVSRLVGEIVEIEKNPSAWLRSQAARRPS